VITYSTGQLDGYGNLVIVDNGPGRAGRFQLYGHLATIAVAAGALIAAGTLIGTVGRTAGTRADPAALTGQDHLHLEFLTAWPPAGRKLDRLDPIAELAGLGIVARFGEPIAAGPGGAPLPPPSAVAATAATAAAGIGLLLILLFAAGALSRIKSQHPRISPRVLSRLNT
jgi:hypothetical protein